MVDILGGLDIPGRFSTIFKRETTVVTSFFPFRVDPFSPCIPAHEDLFEKRSTLKGKNLLPLRANPFLLEENPFQKGNINSLTVTSPESVSIPLEYLFL